MESKFSGGVLGLLGIRILVAALFLFTFGLGFPWCVCFKREWIAKHTVIDGRRLRFDGNGLELFGFYVAWWLLTVVLLLVFAVMAMRWPWLLLPFVLVALCYGDFLRILFRRWVTEHTHFDLNAPVADDTATQDSFFTPGKKRLMVLGAVACTILLLVAFAGFLRATPDIPFVLPTIIEREFPPPSTSEVAQPPDYATQRQARLEKQQAAHEQNRAELARLAAEREAAKEAARQAQAKAEADASARQAQATAFLAERAAVRQALKEQKAKAEEAFRADLDASAPMFHPGEMVEICQNNGIVQKGLLKRFVRHDGVRFAVLETQLSGTVEIPVSDMDTDTRLRCDPAYRESYIHSQIDIHLDQ